MHTIWTSACTMHTISASNVEMQMNKRRSGHYRCHNNEYCGGFEVYLRCSSWRLTVLYSNWGWNFSKPTESKWLMTFIEQKHRTSSKKNIELSLLRASCTFCMLGDTRRFEPFRINFIYILFTQRRSTNLAKKIIKFRDYERSNMTSVWA